MQTPRWACQTWSNNDLKIKKEALLAYYAAVELSIFSLYKNTKNAEPMSLPHKTGHCFPCCNKPLGHILSELICCWSCWVCLHVFSPCVTVRNVTCITDQIRAVTLPAPIQHVLCLTGHRINRLTFSQQTRKVTSHSSLGLMWYLGDVSLISVLVALRKPELGLV